MITALIQLCKRFLTRRSATALPRAVLYTRPDCHLCEVAEAELLAAGMSVEKVNINANPDLERRFGQEIPVVEIAGQIRFRGRVDRLLLRRIVAQYRSGQAS